MNTAPSGATRIDRIRAALESALTPDTCEIVDESHLHAGHAGARSGKGHFRVRIVSPRFSGLTLIKRHRLIYAAVGNLMDSDIHALSIEALEPGEGSD